MGFLLKLTNSSDSTCISTRHHNTQYHNLNRLVLITLLAVAFSTKTYDVLAAVDQTEQDTDFQAPCETITLDDVPPDPVR